MQLLLKQLGIDAERTTGISGVGISGVEEYLGISGVGPLEMCNFETISLSFVVYLLKMKFCEDSLAFLRWL